MLNITILILQFLMAIQGVESNNGKDLNHKVVTNVKSAQFGDSAIGPWALMPNTIKMLKKDLKKFKTNKKYQQKVAEIYALKVLQAAGGCPLKASVLWLKGPSSVPTVLDYTSSRYKRFVQDFELLRGPIEKDEIIMRYCNGL